MKNPKVHAEISSLHLHPGEQITIFFHKTIGPLLGEVVPCEARVTPEGRLEFFHGEKVNCLDLDKGYYEIKTE